MGEGKGGGKMGEREKGEEEEKEEAEVEEEEGRRKRRRRGKRRRRRRERRIRECKQGGRCVTSSLYLVEDHKEHSEPWRLQFWGKRPQRVETLSPLRLFVVHCHVGKVGLNGSSTVS